MPQRDRHHRARKTPHASVKDYERQIDMAALRRYRLGRVRAQLIAHEYAGCLLYNPMNIRYATGTRNMQVYSLHASERYAFVPAEGPVVLFDSYYYANPIDASETVDERRPAISCYFETKGGRVAEAAERMAAEIADLVRAHGGGNRRLAVDRLGIPGIRALEREGLDLGDADVPMETARAIKSPQEIDCMLVAIAACEAGMARMHEALKPGMTEIELWSLLVHGAHALGARRLGRLRHRPDRALRLLRRYLSDLPLRARPAERRTAPALPGRLRTDTTRHRPAAPRHGFSRIGREGLEAGYDGQLEENMVLCVESYIGAEGGAEGVKLEEQVLLTADGPQILSTFPFEDELLS
jgi:Xaa-Pro aminopeptidase